MSVITTTHHKPSKPITPHHHQIVQSSPSQLVLTHLRGDDEGFQVDEGGGVDEGVAHLGEVDEHQRLECLAARHTHLQVEWRNARWKKRNSYATCGSS